MSYETLIERLAADLKPVRRRRAGVDITIMAVICAVELAIFFSLGEARPHMQAMMREPTIWWRLSSLGSITAISCGLAILSFNPAYSPKRGIRGVVLIIGICLAFSLYLDTGPDSLATIIQRLNWTGGIQCTYKMVLLSIPPVIGLSMLMRRGAPTEPRSSALLVGLAAAAWGAFIFVFACPSDDPIYIAVWYSLGCAIVTALSRIILPCLANW